MGKLIHSLLRFSVLSLVLVAVAPTPAHAGLLSDLLGGGSSGSSGTSGSSGSGGSAPEIDPSALAGTLALAAGGVAILAARRRRA